MLPQTITLPITLTLTVADVVLVTVIVNDVVAGPFTITNFVILRL